MQVLIFCELGLNVLGIDPKIEISINDAPKRRKLARKHVIMTHKSLKCVHGCGQGAIQRL